MLTKHGRWYECRHDTEADALRRMSRERERHRHWRSRYEAAQADREARERLLAVEDDYDGDGLG